MHKISIIFFLMLLFNCNEKKSIDRKGENIIVYDSNKKNITESTLPEEMDSINIFFYKKSI